MIYPCIWLKNQAEEAAQLYTSLFKNSTITRKQYYTKSVPYGPEGSVVAITLELNGSPVMLLNGYEPLPHTNAISLVAPCEDQQEIDRVWDGLLANGGQEQACGWLNDRFGVAWQVVPRQLEEWASDPDREKVDRVMAALLKMKKLDLKALEQAYKGELASKS